MHETASASLAAYDLGAFDMAAILVVASALLGWFNHHFLKLPHVIGLTVMGALAVGPAPSATRICWTADDVSPSPSVIV